MSVQTENSHTSIEIESPTTSKNTNCRLLFQVMAELFNEIPTKCVFPFAIVPTQTPRRNAQSLHRQKQISSWQHQCGVEKYECRTWYLCKANRIDYQWTPLLKMKWQLQNVSNQNRNIHCPSAFFQTEKLRLMYSRSKIRMPHVIYLFKANRSEHQSEKNSNLMRRSKCTQLSSAERIDQ